METVKERLLELLGLEPIILLSSVAILSFVFYKVFLRKLSPERHRTLNRIYGEMFRIYVLFGVLWGIQLFLQRESDFSRFYNYFGIAALLAGAVFFVRTVKVIAFEYLFFNSMTEGVPALIVDLATLLFSIFIAAWLSTSVFGVRWAPLLATSAIVSVVLGLALQDTLGNLFAGVSLQFDKPYEIGDWIEVHSERNTHAGEVHEITWRATILHGFYDEVITLPNRVAANSEISNFSSRAKPVYRAVSIYLDVNAPEEEVKAIFLEVMKTTRGVVQGQEHFAMLRGLDERGAQWRLFYPVVDYNRQFVVLDAILMKAQSEFKKRGIQVARIRADLQGDVGATPSTSA